MTRKTLNDTMIYIHQSMRLALRHNQIMNAWSDCKLLLRYANRHPNRKVRSMVFGIMNKVRVIWHNYLRSVAGKGFAA